MTERELNKKDLKNNVIKRIMEVAHNNHSINDTPLEESISLAYEAYISIAKNN